MVLPEVTFGAVGSKAAADAVRCLLGGRKVGEPVLLSLPGQAHTLNLLLANGPQAGLPFIVAFGVPRLQISRYEGYFREIWRLYANSAEPYPSSGLIRGPQWLDGPDRDRLGLKLGPNPNAEAALTQYQAFCLLREFWPDAGLVLLGLILPPFDWGQPPPT